MSVVNTVLPCMSVVDTVLPCMSVFDTVLPVVDTVLLSSAQQLKKRRDRTSEDQIEEK